MLSGSLGGAYVSNPTHTIRRAGGAVAITGAGAVTITPLAGQGVTVSGPLTVSGATAINNAVTITASGVGLVFGTSDATNAQMEWRTNGVLRWYTYVVHSDQSYRWYAGGADRMSLTAAGALSLATSITAGGTIGNTAGGLNVVGTSAITGTLTVSAAVSISTNAVSYQVRETGGTYRLGLRMNSSNVIEVGDANNLLSLAGPTVFFQSGVTVSFAAGDVTITHNTNQLTFAGATSGYAFGDGALIAGAAGLSTAGPFTITHTNINVANGLTAGVSGTDAGVWTLRGGQIAAGSGGMLQLTGKSGGSPGQVVISSPNAAGTGDVTRLTIAGVAATVSATFNQSNVIINAPSTGVALTVSGTTTLTGAVTFGSGAVAWTTANQGTSPAYANFQNTGGTLQIGLDNSAGGAFGYVYGGVLWHTGNRSLVLATNNTPRMVINGSGVVSLLTNNATFNVGTGMVIGGVAISTIRLESTGSGGTAAEIFYNDTALSFQNVNSSREFAFINGKVNIPSSYGAITTDADGATVTFNLITSNKHIVTLGGNRTLAVSNASTGQAFMITLVQDGTGSRTVTWWSGISWAGGSAPTLTTTPGKGDAFMFVCTGAGTYHGFVVGQNI